MTTSATREGMVARLLMQHRATLYGYIFACVRNHADAEDILQTVSVAVTESIAQLTTESGFLPWAREIARRRILAHQRTVRREQPLDPDVVRELADAVDRIEEKRPVADEWEALTACLEALPPHSRKLIIMRYDGTASAEDMARRFGRSVQGIYAQIKRIKAALRNCVEHRLQPEGSS